MTAQQQLVKVIISERFAYGEVTKTYLVDCIGVSKFKSSVARDFATTATVLKHAWKCALQFLWLTQLSRHKLLNDATLIEQFIVLLEGRDRVLVGGKCPFLSCKQR